MGLGKPQQPKDLNKPHLKILVVDDDELNRRMMKVLLGREGYDVDLASNGLEALDAVKFERYDMVFMDLQMPLMDGVESSRQIRNWENGGRRTYIVALTASYLPEEGHILFEAGIDNYIAKPFEVEHIQRMLKYVADCQEESQPVQKPPVSGGSQGLLDIHLGLRRVGGDAETYRELLSDFVEELPLKLAHIQDCLLSRNLIMLGRAAHNLKGVSANLGALPLSDCAGQLDKQCNDGYTDSIEKQILELKEMGSHLQEEIVALLAGANTLESLLQA